MSLPKRTSEGKDRFGKSMLPREPYVGWARSKQILLRYAYHLWWIAKPPLEGRDRTLYWLQKMNQESVTDLLKAAEDSAPADRRIFINHLFELVDYLTKLDAEIVELRSKARMILDKIHREEGKLDGAI